MIALANLPPRIATRHRRWVSSGHRETWTKTMPASNLTLSMRLDLTRQSAPNTQPATFISVYPAQQARHHHHIKQRRALKSP
jgi:hypothetical protein